MLANPIVRHKVFLDLITMAMTCMVSPVNVLGREVFLFPFNPKGFREWIVRLWLEREEVGSNSRVCSDNFRSDCFERYLKAEMLVYM